MTRIFDRYLTRQILTATITAVVVLTLVFGLGNIFKRALPQLVDNTLSVERFGQFILYILPFAIAYTVPWGFLSAVLLTFGRLSADSELISMRMAGVSLFRICRPVFVIAILLSGLCFWLNLSISPQAKWEMKRIVNQLVAEDPSIVFKQKKVLEDMAVSIDPVDARTGKNVKIVQVDEQNRPVSWTFADKIVMGEKADTLPLELFNVRMEVRNVNSAEGDDGYPFEANRTHEGWKFASLPIEIPLPSSKKPKANEMTVDRLRAELRDPALPEDDASEYRTEITKRYSISLACLAFCLIGVPLGVTTQRRETSIGFALSLAVAITYFLFIFVGEIFSDEGGLLPHLLMWAPSVLFVGLGSLLFYRMNKR